MEVAKVRAEWKKKRQVGRANSVGLDLEGLVLILDGLDDVSIKPGFGEGHVRKE